MRTRFAISPMWELVRSLVVLRDPSHAALHVPWLRSLSGRLDGMALAGASRCSRRAATRPTSSPRRRPGRSGASRPTSRRCATREAPRSARSSSCSAPSTRGRTRWWRRGSPTRAARCGAWRTSSSATGRTPSSRSGRGSARSWTPTSPTARAGWPRVAPAVLFAELHGLVTWSEDHLDGQRPAPRGDDRARRPRAGADAVGVLGDAPACRSTGRRGSRR